MISKTIKFPTKCTNSYKTVLLTELLVKNRLKPAVFCLLCKMSRDLKHTTNLQFPHRVQQLYPGVYKELLAPPHTFHCKCHCHHRRQSLQAEYVPLQTLDLWAGIMTAVRKSWTFINLSHLSLSSALFPVYMGYIIKKLYWRSANTVCGNLVTGYLLTGDIMHCSLMTLTFHSHRPLTYNLHLHANLLWAQTRHKDRLSWWAELHNVKFKPAFHFRN